MERIDFIEQFSKLEKNKTDFFKSIYSDIFNVINKYKIVEPCDHNNEIITYDIKKYCKDFFNKFNINPKINEICENDICDILTVQKSSISLSKYYLNIDAYLDNSINIFNKSINCYIKIPNEIRFLDIYFDYLEDDYYLIDIIFFYNLNDENINILKELGIDNHYQVILDQKKELNSFINSIVKILN